MVRLYAVLAILFLTPHVANTHVHSDDAFGIVDEALQEYITKAEQSIENVVWTFNTEKSYCHFVQVIDQRVYVRPEQPTAPLYRWELARLEVNLELLLDWLENEKVENFQFFICTYDCAQPLKRLSVGTVSCKGSLQLPTVQHLAMDSRDPPWNEWPAHLHQLWDLSKDLDWDSRRSKAVFRGGIRPVSLGCKQEDCDRCRDGACDTISEPLVAINENNWHKYSRTRLLYLRSAFPGLLDVAFPPSHYPVYSYLNISWDRNLYPIDEPTKMDLLEQRHNFKYAIYVEGNCGWADRLKHLYLLGFLVLVQETPCGEYYKKFFKPWIHYVPVDGSLENLTDAIQWARNHDFAAKKIAEEGQALAYKVFQQDTLIYYFRQLMRNVARLSQRALNFQNVSLHESAVQYTHATAVVGKHSNVDGLATNTVWDTTKGWWTNGYDD